MKKSIATVMISIFFLSFTAQAQDKHRAEFGLSAIGNIHYASAKPLKVLNEVGINYQRYAFEQTYLVFSLQGISMNYNDDSKDSSNLFKGQLKYNQWQLATGVRHYFKEEIQGTINYFGECSFHYSRFNTLGLYSGGQFGDEFYRQSRSKGVGFGVKAGAIYQSYDNWYVGANIGGYFTGGRKGEVIRYNESATDLPRIENLDGNENLGRFQIELRVGFRILGQ